MAAEPETIVVKVEAPEVKQWEDEEDSCSNTVFRSAEDEPLFGDGVEVEVKEEVEESLSEGEKEEEDDDSREAEAPATLKGEEEEKVEDEDGANDGECAPKGRGGRQRTSTRAASKPSRKPQLLYAERSTNKGLTPDQLKAKKTELQRLRRQKLRETMTEEELEEVKRKERERKRVERASVTIKTEVTEEDEESQWDVTDSKTQLLFADRPSNKDLTPEELRRVKNREQRRQQRQKLREKLTEEELEERKRKERERKRLERAGFFINTEEDLDSWRKRGTRSTVFLAELPTDEDESEGEDMDASVKVEQDEDYLPSKDTNKKSKKQQKKTTKSKSTKGKKSNPKAGLTREELREIWREEARARRRRKRQQMTPEQREEFLKRERERKRELRGTLKKEGSVTVRRERSSENGSELTPEERRRREAEAKRIKRAMMTPQEKEELKQKNQIRRLMKLAAMTEEEKEQKRIRDYMLRNARLSSMSKEKLEEEKKKKAERARLRRAKMNEEQKRVLYERSKRWRQNLKGEKLERAKEQLKKSYYKKMERAKQDPELMEKIKKGWKQSSERRKDPNRKRRMKPGETEEMRIEKMREKKRQQMKKFNLKRRLERQKLLESGVPIDEIRKNQETKEQRERRLIRNRMYRAKQTLREQLTREGLPKEVIQERLNKLVETWTPSRAEFRPYKPKSLKPLDEEELKLLQEDSSDKKGKCTNPLPSSQRESKSQLQSQFTPFRSTTSTLTSAGGGGGAPPSFLPMTNPSSSAARVPAPTFEHHQSFPNFANYSNPYLNYSTSTTSSTLSCLSPSAPGSIGYHPFPPIRAPFSGIGFPNQNQSQSSYCSSTQDDCSSSLAAEDDDYHDESEYFSSSQNPASSPPPPPPSSQPQQHHQNDLKPESYPHPPPPPSVFRQLDSYFGFDRPQPYAHPVSTSPSEPAPSPPTKPKSNRGRPRIHPIPPKGGPRVQKFRGGKFTNAERDKICEHCGYMYSASYIIEHKLCSHNPNYVNGKCVLCGEEFSTGKKFYYQHWVKVHKVKEVEKNADGTPKETFMCDECGAGPFYKRGTFYSHRHYSHGSLGVNVPCEHCLKIFTTVRSLYTHIRKFHKDVKKSAAFWKCLKCEESFSAYVDLKQHVKTQHPESFFACPDCEVFKYTEANRKFHWGKCPKRDKTKGEGESKEVGDEDVPSIEKIMVPCEVCGIEVRLSSLTRHYKDIHGVVDELFKCGRCPKTFKRREYWVAHLEMLHSLDLDEIREEISGYNVSDRSKVEVKNPEGGHKGLPGYLWANGEWLKKNARGKKKRSSRGRGAGRGRTLTRGGGRGRGRGGRRSTRKVYSSEEDEESEEEDNFLDDNDTHEDFGLDKEVGGSGRQRRRGGQSVYFCDDDIEVEKRLVISVVPLSDKEISDRVGVREKKEAEKVNCVDNYDDSEQRLEIDAAAAADELQKMVVDKELGIEGLKSEEVGTEQIIPIPSLNVE